MVSEFISRLSRECELVDHEVEILAEADIWSYEDLDSLTRSFPSLADELRLNMLSNIAALRTSAAYAQFAAAGSPPIAAASSGAEKPPSAPWQIGTAASGIPPSGSPLQSPSAYVPDAYWPVRDQGDRGTCVAFSTAACTEHARAGGVTPIGYLSPQFLYWAIKTSTPDPRPNQDGTRLEFANSALMQLGVCEEQFWPYNGTPGATISQGTPVEPTSQARANAATNRFAPRAYHPSTGAPRDADIRLNQVLQGIRGGRPVAVTLPVFRDPSIPPGGDTNWTTVVGTAYGHVLNPPRRSVVVGGHAICVIGFEADQAEGRGGYFVFRNSWGTQWAFQPASSGRTYPRDPGYGFVSATYMAEYLWELVHY